MHPLADWVGDAGVKFGKPDLKVRPKHSENKVQEEGFAFDSVHLPDLTAGQYRNLLDLAHLVISHTTIDALFPTLALRLQHALNFHTGFFRLL